MYAEQLIPVQTIKSTNNDNEKKKLAWKCTYGVSHINPLQKGPAKEWYALEWDPSSSGGIAKFFDLDEDRVYALTRNVNIL
jgi:hypothetical protein